MSMLYSLILLACFLSLSCSSKKKIYIGGLVPSYTFDLFGYQAALELATEIINNSSEILEGYEVIVKYGDTFGSPTYTVRCLFELFKKLEKEPLHMIIGPAWSNNAVLSAMMCESFGIYQISYAATSIDIHLDDTKYRLLYTNVPSVSSINKARLAIIKYFGWENIAILQQHDDEMYSSNIQDLRDQITAENLSLTITAIEGFGFNYKSHPRVQLEKLLKIDARIIIGEFSSQGAARVFCEAYKLGMYGSKYVWFVPNSFTYSHPSVNCDVRMIAEATAGSIAFDKIPIRQDNTKTASGLTAQDFKREIRKRNPIARFISSYAFDALWAAALVLNKSLSEPGMYHLDNVTETFENGDSNFKKLLGETEFEGMTGAHKFFGRQRLGTVRVSQMRWINNSAKYVQFGSHYTVKDKLVLDKNEANKLWKDGKVPVDEARTERQILEYSLVYIVTITSFSILGVLYSLGFLYFNVAKRNHKVVKLSSPLINNVVLLGCLLCYVFVLLFGVDTRFINEDVLSILCNVRLYVLAIAFSLSFGALFSKTWRVHKIFTAHRAIKKKMMKDIHLILFVLFLVIIDVIFISIWVYFDPLRLEDITFDQKKESSVDRIIIPVLRTCECAHRIKFLGGLYAYKGLLLLFGLFLAWETREVTIPALNDSKYIGISVYNVVILSAIGVAVSMILKKTVYYQLLYVLVSTVVILSTTFTLTIMFLPKLIEYYFAKPELEKSTRTLESLRGTSVHISATLELSNVYNPAVQRDVKHKWIQTENIGEDNFVGGDTHQQTPSYQEQREFLDDVYM